MFVKTLFADAGTGKTLLQTLDGEIREVRLHENPLPALDINGVEKERSRRNPDRRIGDRLLTE